MNLASRYFDTLAPGDNRPAVREAGGAIVSRGELRQHIIGLQHTLTARGFKKGDTVVIQAPTGAPFAAATIAVAALGGVSLLAEPGLGDEVYARRLMMARPRWTLVHPAVLWANRIPGARGLLARREILVPPLLPTGPNLRQLTLSSSALRRMAAGNAKVPTVEDMDARDDVAVIFTGGTTSLPKGVRLSHGAVAHTLDNIALLASGTGAETLIADTPMQALFGLALGRKVLATRGRTRKRAALVRSLVDSGEADAYFGSPFVWMEMMEQAGPGRRRLPSSLKAVFLGGAPVTREFLATLRAWLSPETKVSIVYGLTEAGPVTHASDREKINWDGEGDLLGHLMPGTRATIDDKGEIAIAGPTLFTGYVGQSEIRKGSTFATGDLGRLVEIDGEEMLVLMGRAKDMIIRAAVNIYPATLEAGLRGLTDHAGKRMLREAALIGLWDETKQDEAVVLCWQPMPGTVVDEAALARAVVSVTGEAARPNFMLRCDPIPVTGRQNKVDKQALRALAAERFGLKTTPMERRKGP
jgi:acyl-CoA synthetase (AMP-forming)/AMP-acid ligase II